MLIQFTVENFMSFRNRVTLSLLADNDREHNERLLRYKIKEKKQEILPVVALYGANAAGKSNIIKALSAALLIIRESNTRQSGEKISRIIPFLMDKDSQNKPTLFGFIFVVNGTKYEYSFLADVSKVYEESLYVYKSAKASLIFERTDTNKYKFSQANEKRFREYEKKNTDNKLFLSTATNWNCVETQEPYRWLASEIDSYDSRVLEALMPNRFAEDTGGELREFVTRFLHEADINLDGYNVKITDMMGADIGPGISINMFEGQHNISRRVKKVDIFTQHTFKRDGICETYNIPLSLESDGTRKMFFFSPIIKDALEQGKTVFIDEIDRSLHPILVKYIVDIFNDKEKNPNGAQLIFNTHDVELLNLKIFRRDQIYFVEKDYSTGVSDLYSLDEYSPRKSEDIHKGYIQGRYGAIPYVGGKTSWDE